MLDAVTGRCRRGPKKPQNYIISSFYTCGSDATATLAKQEVASLIPAQESTKTRKLGSFGDNQVLVYA